MVCQAGAGEMDSSRDVFEGFRIGDGGVSGRVPLNLRRGCGGAANELKDGPVVCGKGLPEG